MAFKLKDLMISLLPKGGAAEACPTASAPAAQFCPTASAGFCQMVSGRAFVVMPHPLCPTASAGFGFCPTASAGLAFCPTASATGAAEACPTASAPAESAASPEGLAALKQQLQEALAQVEAQEKALAAQHLPQTIAETEELEARLREALDELRQHKETLKK